MADDLGVVYTDKHLSDLEKALRRVYSQAEEEIGKKIDKFTQRTTELEEKKLAKVKAGTMTQDEFDAWKRGRAFYGDEWESQRAEIANVLANANETALKMLRGEQYDVFGFNSNYAAYEMEHGFGVNLDFKLYDKKTVERLLTKDPDILPFKRLDKIKDARWNFKNIKSQITQGILQGESIPEIAKRLASVVPNRNEKQMVLHARTAMTSAQNGGRLERYKEAEELGIKFKKVWLATLDGRTRDLHADLDGQEVDPDDDFEIDGYAVRYPGDPWGEPEMVYNCRCTMTTKLVDYPSQFDRRGKGEDGYENFGNLTYKEWEGIKQKSGSGYYKDLSVLGFDKKTTDILNSRFKELDAKYGARVNGVENTVDKAIREYDTYHDNYVNHLLGENPGMTRAEAEKRTVALLGERPDKDHQSVNMFLTGGDFNLETRLLTMNSGGSLQIGTVQDDIEYFRRKAERDARRLEKGLQVFPAGNAGTTAESVFIHEYGHAIDAHYGVSDDPRFVSFMNKYAKNDIKYGVSEYAATNPQEFIAECFTRSYMGEYQGDVSKGFMSVLREIVNDKRK